jgi:hypothetical protein
MIMTPSLLRRHGGQRQERGEELCAGIVGPPRGAGWDGRVWSLNKFSGVGICSQTVLRVVWWTARSIRQSVVGFQPADFSTG